MCSIGEKRLYIVQFLLHSLDVETETCQLCCWYDANMFSLYTHFTQKNWLRNETVDRCLMQAAWLHLSVNMSTKMKKRFNNRHAFDKTGVTQA